MSNIVFVHPPPLPHAPPLYHYRYAEQYIKDAPAGSNVALDIKWQRRHATRATSAGDLKIYTDDVAGKSTDYATGGPASRFVTKENPKGSLYSRKVPTSDDQFTNHKRTDRIKSLFEYRPAVLAGDKRVSYVSAKFPWLESVHKFQNLANHGGDTEVVRIGIDDIQKKGSGHFIAHWRWQGYRECVDIDYFDDRQIKNVDGKAGEGVVWNKVEHCQFEDPGKVLSPCRAVASTAKACVNDLMATIGGTLKSANSRVGINVVPLKMPPAVKMWDKTVAPPWDQPACVNENSLTTLLGTDSAAPPGDTGGWAGWRASSRVTEVAGKRCKDVLWDRNTPNQKSTLSGEWTMTLRDAVLTCTESPCAGFAWKLRNAGDKFEVDRLDVTFCKTTELVGSTIWAGAVLKDGTALVKPPLLAFLRDALPFIPPTSAADATAVYKDAIMVKYTRRDARREVMRVK